MGGPLGRGWGSPLWAFGSRRGGERGEHRCGPEDLGFRYGMITYGSIGDECTMGCK